MVLILGGGLSGCLIAYKLALLEHPPDFLLLEAGTELCGNHTWSFHDSDVPEQLMRDLRPLISKSWDSQEVRFKNYQRIFNTGYHSIISSEFSAKVLRTVSAERILLGKRVKSVEAGRVILEDGQELKAEIILDARGAGASDFQQPGFQKFYGMDLELEAPHQLKRPVIMDADCDQKESYRFFYLLPWSATSLLIEDTRYSNSPEIEGDEFETEIYQYCAKMKWRIKKVSRIEKAALPIPLHPMKFQMQEDLAISVGVRGGYFHLTTGYSLPQALEVAEIISNEFKKNPDLTQFFLHSRLRSFYKQGESQSRFFGLLNRMLFLAAIPEERWRIFSRFYRFQEQLIFRFYRGKLKKRHQLRILVGRPPVPVLNAIQSIFYKPKNDV